MVKILLWLRCFFSDVVVLLVFGFFDWEDFVVGDFLVIDIGWCDVIIVFVWKY